MPPHLVAITEGPNILLDKPIILIGRHQECDIQIPSRKISRRHCCVAQVNDHLVVRDLCSTNGIRINGVRIQEGNLKPGDELTIGSYKYHLSWASHEPFFAPAVNGNGALPRLVAVEDQACESRDEPVPLPDPLAVAGKISFPQALPSDKASSPRIEPPSEQPPIPAAPSAVGIPDDMGLRPMSDSRIPPGRAG